MQRDYSFAHEADGGPAGKAVARILSCRGCSFALAQHTTLEILEDPQALAVPQGSPHAIGLLPWQGRRIALIDAGVLLAGALGRAGPPRYALVVAMQSAPGLPIEHGAIALDTLPRSVLVDDGAWCPIPQGARWHSAAISCFTHEGRPIPIVDTARLFGRG